MAPHARDKYEMLHKVGQGAYGEVWKAVIKETGKEVAIKDIKLQKRTDGVERSAIDEIRLMQVCSRAFAYARECGVWMCVCVRVVWVGAWRVNFHAHKQAHGITRTHGERARTCARASESERERERERERGRQREVERSCLCSSVCAYLCMCVYTFGVCCSCTHVYTRFFLH